MTPEKKEQIDRLKKEALSRATTIEAANIVMLAAILDSLSEIQRQFDQVSAGGSALLTERA